MKNQTAIDWLLEENQPCVRYLALTQLLGRTEDDSQVAMTRKMTTMTGWAAEILAKQTPQGWWVTGDKLYRPKYISTNWMLLILSDLGLTKQEPRIRKACELWITGLAKKDGGFGPQLLRSPHQSGKLTKGHLCTTGNTARALVKFGYADHPKVKRSFDWLVKNQNPKGGWSCFGSGRNLDSWEPMSAFAALPPQKRTKSINRAVEMGAEFFLERELHKQGTRYPPWYRFHYPVHYYYDVLVGLDFMTSLGYGDDKRMKYAIRLLKKKRRQDNKWLLDAVHPDVEGGMMKWFNEHPKDKPIPFSLEKPGQPSKMITLTAMRVLSKLR